MSEPEPTPERKTARVITTQQQQQAGEASSVLVVSSVAENADEEELEEKQTASTKLTECVEFDQDADVRWSVYRMNSFAL